MGKRVWTFVGQIQSLHFGRRYAAPPNHLSVAPFVDVKLEMTTYKETRAMNREQIANPT